MEWHNISLKVAWENKLFWSSPKKYYRVSWAWQASSKVQLGVIWPEISLPGGNQWQSGELGHIKSYTAATGAGIAHLLIGADGEIELNGKKSVIWIKMDDIIHVCIQLLKFAIFRSCCKQAHAGHSFTIASQELTGFWSFVFSVSNSVKSPVV